MEANHQSTNMHAMLGGTSTPTGFRFFPTEKEILVDYLLNKVTEQPLPSDVIKEIDLYGDEKIWQRLFEGSGESFFYFFTKLKKKFERGSRIGRVAGFGCWRAQKDTEIFYNKQHIGSKRTFSYVAKGKQGSSKAEANQGRWTMTEYRLNGCLLNNVKNNGYVVCLIKKMKRKGFTQKEDDGIDIIDADVSEHYSGGSNNFQQLEQTKVCTANFAPDNIGYFYSQTCDTPSPLHQIQMSSVESNALTSMERGADVAGDYSLSKQEVQMAPTEPNNVISTSKEFATFEAQGQIMESGSNDVVTDDLRYIVYPQEYGYDSFSQEEVTASTWMECGSYVAGDYSPSQQEAQMAPTEQMASMQTSGISASMEVIRRETQGQMMEYSGSNSVVTDDLGYVVHPESYGYDSSSCISEVSFESQEQRNETGSTNVTGEYVFMNEIEWLNEIEWVDSLWA